MPVRKIISTYDDDDIDGNDSDYDIDDNDIDDDIDFDSDKRNLELGTLVLTQGLEPRLPDRLL